MFEKIIIKCVLEILLIRLSKGVFWLGFLRVGFLFFIYYMVKVRIKLLNIFIVVLCEMN